MNISRVGLSTQLRPNFKAHTVINAPEYLLSKQDKAKLVKQGQKIGTDDDTIEINVSEVKESDRDPGVMYYNISERYNLTLDGKKCVSKKDSSYIYSTKEKFYERNLPKNVIGRYMDERINFGLFDK